MSASSHPDSVLFAYIHLNHYLKTIKTPINDAAIKFWKYELDWRIIIGLRRISVEDKIIRPLIDDLIDNGVMSKAEYYIQWEQLEDDVNYYLQMSPTM